MRDVDFRKWGANPTFWRRGVMVTLPLRSIFGAKALYIPDERQWDHNKLLSGPAAFQLLSNDVWVE
jgi:hypothetical protein